MRVSILLLLACAAFFSCSKQTIPSVSSPDESIVVTITTGDSGRIFYEVRFNENLVINQSELGVIREDADFSSDMQIDSVSDIIRIDDSYSLLHGKKSEARYVANKRIYHCSEKGGEKMDIIFQVSNDGMAFCYHFPSGSEDIKKIATEITSFNFPDSTIAWIQPRARAKSGWNGCNPSYEEHYWKETPVESLSPNDTGWVMPALFKTGNCWINITESWPDRNYCGSHLQKGISNTRISIAFPDSSERFTSGVAFPQSKTPWTTPWRIITIGGSPAVIAESTLGTDLAKPPQAGDYSYVKPGRASWSWVLMKDPSVNFEVQNEFIRYASEMGWEYCLIDADWDTRIGWEKIEKLANTAKKLDVGLILWYNSAGDWNTVPYHPKDLLLTSERRNKEFERLHSIGIKGIKVDFFGGDGQSMMDYYQDILEDAHKYQIMVNFHGATYPRGLHRTHPNLVSMEAIRGLEYATFGQETADLVPSKATLLAFTRNAFDPMDFTPVCFNEYDNQKRITGNAMELALSILFLSGVQHYAETPAGMAKVPDYVRQYMKDIPVTWDETRFIEGYPGRYLVLARRSGTTWYVAGVNATNDTKVLKLSLPFNVQGELEYITEGDSLRSFNYSAIMPGSDKTVSVSMQPNGGFVLKSKQ